MISLVEVRKVFVEAFAEGKIGIPVAYENLEEDKKVKTAREKREEWIRLVIREADTQQITIGHHNPLNRTFGVCILQIFVKRGNGDVRIRKIYDDLSKIVVELQTATDWLIVRRARLEIAGTDDSWFQANMTIPFEANQYTE